MIFDIIGWAGTFCVLLALVLVSTARLRPITWQFFGLNLFGSCALVLSTWSNGSFPAMALNIFAALVALQGFWRLSKKEYDHPKQ